MSSLSSLVLFVVVHFDFLLSRGLKDELISVVVVLSFSVVVLKALFCLMVSVVSVL